MTSEGWKRTLGSVNIRDELLMSLLTSEAVVDSRECEILSAEEVEELKKVRMRITLGACASRRLTSLSRNITPSRCA